VTLLLWLAAVCGGVAVMQWGAGRICAVFRLLRGRIGLAEVAGGALVGLATASPEISINVTAAALGWPDLGLGTALGSNVPAIPFIITISYLSTRLNRGKAAAEYRAHPTEETEAPRSVPHVKAATSSALALPYFLILLLLAALTLPPPWAGLQPIDGAILFAAFVAYFVRVTRAGGADSASAAAISWRDVFNTALGLTAIAAGAILAVLASRRVNDSLGVSDLVGGLFITGLLCALPECIAAWGLSRRGQATSAISGAMSDGITSLTIALIPCALIGLPLTDIPLYVANLGFVALCLAFYMVSNNPRWGERLPLSKVAAYGGGYLAYLGIVFLVTRP